MGIEDIPIAREGEQPSAAGHNAMRELLGRDHTGPLLLVDWTGIHHRHTEEEDGREFQYFELYDALAPGGSAEAYPMNWDNATGSYVTDLEADTFTVYDVPPGGVELDGRLRGRGRDETAGSAHDLDGERGKHGSQGLAIWRNGRWEICWLQPHATWITCLVDESSFTGGPTITVDDVVVTKLVEMALLMADVTDIDNVHGWDDLADDTFQHATWNDSTQRFEAIHADQDRSSRIRFAKAQAGWDCEDDPATVSVKFSNMDGTGETGAAFEVVLLSSDCQDPNVCVGNVIAVARSYSPSDSTGTYIAVSSYLDDKIGTIKMWSGCPAEDIPCGWALCDGTNGTVDLSGKFVVGIGGSGKDGGPYECEDTGGYAYHGDLENDHDDHHVYISPIWIAPQINDHDDHPVGTLSHGDISIGDHEVNFPDIPDHLLHFVEPLCGIDNVGGAACEDNDGSPDPGTTEVVDSHQHPIIVGVGEYIHDIANPDHSTHGYTSRVQSLPHTVDPLPPHPSWILSLSSHVVEAAFVPGYQDFLGHTTTDNRPPYYALAFIQRICACTPS